MLNINKFTLKSQEALDQSQKIATEHLNSSLEPSHILLALLRQEEGIVRSILASLGVNNSIIEKKIHTLIDTYHTEKNINQINISKNTIEVLEVAQEYAKQFGDDFVSTEHIFLALIDVPSPTQQILAKQQITVDSVLKILTTIRGSAKITDPEPEFQSIDKYTTNLTNFAKEKKLDPVIGRDQEIRRVIQVLSRRTKNNPVLIGEAGTGKTAIVEGLAQRIISGDVPEGLKNKDLLNIDMGALIAGTKFRGEFENRLKSLLKEIKNSNGKFILFIDEIHTVIGAGSIEGAMDAANLLKPALARGELRMIGATTLKEYQRNIEKDPAFERRFQPIYVGEPSVEDTIAILRGIKEKYEIHHGVRITDDALLAAAQLSNRYITDRSLPDKAIDLIDEAASALKIEIETMPDELDRLKRMIIKKEIEREALKKEPDTDVKVKLTQLESEVKVLKEQEHELELRWKNERENISQMREIKSKIEVAQQEAESAERATDLGKVAEIRYGTIPTLQNKLKELEKGLANLTSNERMLKEKVTEEDIASVVSRWTGVPTNQLLKTEVERLLNAETELGKRVIAQPEAIKAIANALRRSRVGLADKNRPLGSFLFLGPTGVGKTELAKALATFMFDNEQSLVRLDMSEYMERHAAARLVGSPPGYVGYEEGGQLTEKIRRRPYSVILFDEIEKAHPDFFNILLQILDDGRLTDSKGRVVNFKNTIIIMTSNIGNQMIKDYTIGFNPNGSKKNNQLDLDNKILESLKESFKPEFLNRLDEIVIFHSLTEKDMVGVVEIQLTGLIQRLKQQNIELKIANKAKQALAKMGYDEEYGARPLRRLIEREIVNPLAQLILENNEQIKQVTVDYHHDEFKINS